MKIDDYNLLLTYALDVKSEAQALNLKAESLLKMVHWHDPARRVTVKEIQKLVAQNFGISRAQMMEKNRAEIYVTPRWVAMYLVREILAPSLQVIADEFGDFDHSTVIHAVRRLGDLMETQPALREKVLKLRQVIEEKLK